jgi:hexosaminidase
MFNPNPIALLPRPNHLQVNGEALLSPSAFVLHWQVPVDPRVESYANELLAQSQCGSLYVHVQHAQALNPPVQADESHSISIRKDGIHLSASNTWGALRGVATLHQLAVANELFLGLTIEDSPRFHWRGLLLDVARHFLPVEDLLAVVDGLAVLKMNVLHIHFSDDQAYRLPSSARPQLPSAEHYSKQQLLDLVAYAADRGVRIVAELDVPGHVTHWLAAYPEWGMYEVQPSERFGVHKACLNPTDEVVYTALDAIFTEVIEIFPDDFVHVGGDEVNPSWWSDNPQAQAFIDTHNLVDVRGLQNYFLQRLSTMLETKGKQVIAWDEVLHADMPGCVVQNWRGITTRDRALALSRDCVVSGPFYLDLLFPADLHYGFDPLGSQKEMLALEDGLADDLRLQHIAEALAWTHQWREGAVDLDEKQTSAQVLGGEACLWAELVDSPTLMPRLWSRLPAVAEVLWSNVKTPVAEDHIQDFYRRLNSSWRALPNDPEQCQNQALAKMGFSQPQQFVLSHLEPVKWYGRLLGEQALQARLSGTEMPQARPYGVNTPLTNVIDFIMPESMAARRLAAALDVSAISQLKADCQAQAPNLPWPAQVQDALDVLVKACDLMLKFFSGELAAENCRLQLLTLYKPQGEFMVAVIPHFIDHLLQPTKSAK